MILKIIWVLFGITFPLLGIPYGRVEIGPFHIAIPMFLMGLILLAGVVNTIVKPHFNEEVLIPPKYIGLALLCFLFVSWHGVGVLTSESTDAAVEEMGKLSVGIVCFLGTLAFFPKDRIFLQRFLVFMLWSCSLWLAYLVYLYVHVFSAAYLGVDIEGRSRAARNLMAWILMPSYFFSFFYALTIRKNMIVLPPLMILTASLIYFSSRGVWVSLSAGFVFFVILFLLLRGLYAFRLVFRIFILGVLISGVICFLFLPHVDMSEITKRFVYIFNPELAPEFHTYETRMALLRLAWDGFLESPVIGTGLGNSVLYVGRLTHNDYATLLLELGVIGAMLFLSILLFIGWRIVRCIFRTRRYLTWMILGAASGWVAVSVSLLTINLYTGMQFWFVLSLFLVVAEIQEEHGEEMDIASMILFSEKDEALRPPA